MAYNKRMMCATDSGEKDHFTEAMERIYESPASADSAIVAQLEPVIKRIYPGRDEMESGEREILTEVDSNRAATMLCPVKGNRFLVAYEKVAGGRLRFYCVWDRDDRESDWCKYATADDFSAATAEKGIEMHKAFLAEEKERKEAEEAIIVVNLSDEDIFDPLDEDSMLYC